MLIMIMKYDLGQIDEDNVVVYHTSYMPYLYIDHSILAIIYCKTSIVHELLKESNDEDYD